MSGVKEIFVSPDIFSSTVLGIVQGLTEFLPVSSSGHLVLFQNVLGMKEPELLLDVSLHFGTLLAILFFFRAELSSLLIGSVRGLFSSLSMKKGLGGPYKEELRWLFLIIIGNIPTAIAGLCFKSSFESLFGSIHFVSLALILTGFMLWFTRGRSQRKMVISDVGIIDAFVIGISQAIAIAPGISRSGATISLGLMLGLERELSARYSFLLSIPAVAGAMALELFSSTNKEVDLLYLIVGAFVSTATGYLALRLLIRVVKKGDFYLFSPYLWALGLLIFILSIVLK